MFLSIAIFSIFLGSQITEGFILLPYWKTLSRTEFYQYYATFGPAIGRFYSILTVIAALIPVSITVYCFYIKSDALKYAIASTIFAFLFIAIFYVYFKGTHQQFYASAFSASQLKAVLSTWGHWHWLRVLLECLSLLFLMLALEVRNGH